MRFLIATALVGLVVPLSRAADDAKEAAKKLEGTYEVLDVIHDGKPDPKKDEIDSFVIKGDEIIVTSKGREEPVKFTLDPSKSPAHIDILPKNDKVVKGIYMVKETDKGLEFTIVFTDGNNGEQPKDFKGASEKEIVIKLLRKKK